MNNVNLIGNVTKLDSVPNGDFVFTLAVRRSDTTDTIDTFGVMTTGEQAKIAKQFLQVGRRVAIEGSVLPDGTIIARIIHLLGKAN